MPSLCIISETIGEENAIGRVAMAQAVIALQAGFKVALVANQLSPSLRSDVEWLRLTVPPRGFLLKWVTARAFMKSAMRRRRFDVVHAHQPQAASLADVFTCHFLTRVAFERKSLEPCASPRSTLVRLQQQAVLHVEDYFYRHWNCDTQMLFCSDLVRQEFERLYGAPRHAQVMINPSPPDDAVTPAQRQAAQRRFLGREVATPVIGYLGGFEERKGYRRLLDALDKLPGATLLVGGPRAHQVEGRAADERVRIVGPVNDVRSFYAACDVFAVPSLFDPCPLVVFEAAARRIPVIATDGVGNLPQILRYGAGLRWDGVSPLAPLISQLLNERATFQSGAQRMTAACSTANHASCLRDVYQRTLHRKFDSVRSPGAGEDQLGSPQRSTCPVHA